jgi:uncharacterized membrane protein
MTRKSNLSMLVQMTMLIALVVVLQVISAMFPIGGVSITLTLVPVVVGAILFGVKGGGILGAAFGLIVLINCISGMDPGGAILWSANPFFTAFLCFAKGIAAGVIPALLYRLLCGDQHAVNGSRKYVSAMVAALSAPIVNTALFVCGMMLFFMDTLQAWAGGTNLVSYVLFGLAGINFLVEFIINIVLTPAIVRIVAVVKHKMRH